MNKKFLKIFIIIVLISAFLSGIFFGADQYFSLEYIKLKQADLLELINKNFSFYYILFFILYIVVTAFALPIAVLKTLLAGALFGFLPGLILTSFASTIGSALCFALSRFAFKDYVQNKYPAQIKKINDGIEKDGDLYLLFLRLSPIFPFFIINLVFGLTKMSLKKFYIISQIGMLPATAIFVNAGLQISSISKIEDILSFNIIVSLSLIGFLPIIVKKIYNHLGK